MEDTGDHIHHNKERHTHMVQEVGEDSSLKLDSKAGSQEGVVEVEERRMVLKEEGWEAKIEVLMDLGLTIKPEAFQIIPT